ncbi:hypothetical protein GBA52_025288 [Prunus armeniaca]|nr:hypothetical protein GBA52_025288 [Prunus armeniaca]
MPEIAEDLSSESLAWANLLGSCRFQGELEDIGRRIVHYDDEVAKKLSFMTTDTQAIMMGECSGTGLSQSSRVIPPSNEMGNAQMKIVFSVRERYQ